METGIALITRCYADSEEVIVVGDRFLLDGEDVGTVVGIVEAGSPEAARLVRFGPDDRLQFDIIYPQTIDAADLGAYATGGLVIKPDKDFPMVLNFGSPGHMVRHMDEWHPKGRSDFSFPPNETLGCYPGTTDLVCLGDRVFDGVLEAKGTVVEIMLPKSANALGMSCYPHGGIGVELDLSGLFVLGFEQLASEELCKMSDENAVQEDYDGFLRVGGGGFALSASDEQSAVVERLPLTPYYTDTEELIQAGDRIALGRFGEGTVADVLQPRTAEAATFSCYLTGGLLLDIDNYYNAMPLAFGDPSEPIRRIGKQPTAEPACTDKDAPALTEYYTDSNELIRTGNKVTSDVFGNGTVVLIIRPKMYEAIHYSCYKTGGLLIEMKDKRLTILPFGCRGQIQKANDQQGGVA